MNIGEILSKAGKIIWKYKVLWIFGIFASCSANINSTGSSTRSSYTYTDLPPGLTRTLDNVDIWIWVAIGVVLFILTLVIIAIVMALSTFGRIGLVQGTALADEDEDAEITFSGLFNSGKPFFWRVLGMNLLIGLIFFVAFVLIGFFYLFATLFTLGFALICLLPLLCLLVPIIWFISTFVEMANVAVVVDDLSITEGIQRGWTVFKDNLGNMVVMALVLILGGMVVSMFVSIPLMLAMAPMAFGFFSLLFGDANNLSIGSIVLSSLCMVAYLPILLVVGGIVRAYILSAWTLTYLRLTREDAGDLEPLPEPEPPSAPKGELAPQDADETPEAENPPETAESPEPDESPTPTDDEEIPEDF
jgi:hypothetical protein